MLSGVHTVTHVEAAGRNSFCVLVCALFIKVNKANEKGTTPIFYLNNQPVKRILLMKTYTRNKHFKLIYDIIQNDVLSLTASRQLQS